MDTTSLFFYLISLTLVLISFAILKKKAGYQVNFIVDGKCTKYSLNEINKLKKDLKDVGIYKPVVKKVKGIYTSPLKTITYSSKSGKLLFEQTSIGMLDTKYKHQREEALSKIKDGLGVSLKGKLTPSFNLSLGEPLKGRNKYNKQTKSILKKDTFTKSDYENLSKLIEDQEKLARLTDSNKEKLEEKIKEEAKSIDYINIKEKDTKYDFLEKHAKSLGFQDEYDKAKKTAVMKEINKVGLKENATDNRDIHKLESVAKQEDLEDRLVEKYVSTFEEELKKDSDNKLDVLKSILEYTPVNISENVAEKVREKLLVKEKEYILSKSNDLNEDIKDLNKNIFFDSKIVDERKRLLKEAEMLKSIDKDLPEDLYKTLVSQDEKIIKDIINAEFTFRLFSTFLDKNKMQEVTEELIKRHLISEDNKLIIDKGSMETKATNDIDLIFDDDKKYAFLKLQTKLPSTQALAENEEISTLINEQILRKKGHINDIAETMFELINYEAEREKLENKLGKTGDFEHQKMPKIKTELGKLIHNNWDYLFDKDISLLDYKKGVVSEIYDPGKTSKAILNKSKAIKRKLTQPKTTEKNISDLTLDNTPASEGTQVNISSGSKTDKGSSTSLPKTTEKNISDLTLDNTPASEGTQVNISSGSKTDNESSTSLPKTTKNNISNPILDNTPASEGTQVNISSKPNIEKADKILEELENKYENDIKKIPGGNLIFLRTLNNSLYSRQGTLNEDERTLFEKLKYVDMSNKRDGFNGKRT